MKKTLVDQCIKRIRERGFITTTVIDHTMEEVLQQCEQQGMRVRIDHFTGFITITQIGKRRK